MGVFLLLPFFAFAFYFSLRISTSDAALILLVGLFFFLAVLVPDWRAFSVTWGFFLLIVTAGIFLMILSDGFSRTRHWKNRKNSSVKNTGMVIAFGIALHNFLEGMAVGSGFEAEFTLGISLAVAVMLHDVPEGMSIAIPLRAGGMKRMKAFALALASGLPMGLGAMFGAWAGKITAVYIAVSLAVAGGAMLYIVFVNMLPESKYIYKGRLGSFGGIAGMISGIIVSVKLG